MKLNCGPTLRERKFARIAREEAYYARMFTEGEVVFAWLPIRIGPNECVWLERIKRTLHGYKLEDNVYGPNETGSRRESVELAAKEIVKWASSKLVWSYEVIKR